MGLMLSILVVCVGVIEALSCYEHFQYGILHCATNIYEHARRRSSVFLNYTSRRLKLLSEDSIAEDDNENSQRLRLIDEPVDDFIDFEPRKRSERENKSKGGKKLAKFEKQDKIDIVKKLLEKPSRPPRAARSISMPERTSLIYTEKDLELTKIINELAIEPIDEINVEVEELDNESVIEEFDKLFDEPEEKLNSNTEGSIVCQSEPVCLRNSKVEDIKNEIKENKKEVVSKINKVEEEVSENEDSEEKNEFKTNTNSISQKISKFDKPVKISRSTSIDLDKVSLLLSKSTSMDSDRPKRQSTPKRLPEINSTNKSPSPDVKLPSSINVIFENENPPDLIDKTFEELFSDINEDSMNEEDVELDEIENIIIEALDNETVENLGKDFISSEIAKYIENNKTEIKNQKTKDKPQIIKVSDEEPINEKYLQLLNKLADRIVCECLSEIRNLELNNLKLEILKKDEKSESFQQSNKINIQTDLRSQNLVLTDLKTNKIEDISKEAMTNLSNSSKIKLPEANDKTIILENQEKEQLQEPLNERKMTDENKNKNQTPIKLQLSLEEETTESSGRSSPTGSVITILSMGSDDSATSTKASEASTEAPRAQDLVKTSEKMLALTNEPVPALEYKPPVSEVCKENVMIPMKWTDQVDKELSTKKDIIDAIIEAEQQELEKAPIKSTTEKILETLSETKSLPINEEIAEVKHIKEERQEPAKAPESSHTQKEGVLKVTESLPEIKSETIENIESQIIPFEIQNECKEENSKSISSLLTSIEPKQEIKPGIEEKALNIPDVEKQPQDISKKSIEEVIAKQEATTIQEKVPNLNANSTETHKLGQNTNENQKPNETGVKTEEMVKGKQKKEEKEIRLDENIKQESKIVVLDASDSVENQQKKDLIPNLETEKLIENINEKQENRETSIKTEDPVEDKKKKEKILEKVDVNLNEKQDGKKILISTEGMENQQKKELISNFETEKSIENINEKQEDKSTPIKTQDLEEDKRKQESVVIFETEKLIENSNKKEGKDALVKAEESGDSKQKKEISTVSEKEEMRESLDQKQEGKEASKAAEELVESKQKKVANILEKEELIESTDLDHKYQENSLKTEEKKGVSNLETEKSSKKEDVTLCIEKPSEVLGKGTENLLAIDYKQKTKPPVAEDSKSEVIPMEWKPSDVKEEKKAVSGEGENENISESGNVSNKKEIVGNCKSTSNDGNKELEKNIFEMEMKSTSKTPDDGIKEGLKTESKAVLEESKPKEEILIEKKEIENQSLVGEKSLQAEKPMLAIKGETVLALEYKRKENINPEETKQEIIPMEWRVDTDAPKSEKTTEILKPPESPKILETTTHTAETNLAETQIKTLVSKSSSSKQPPPEGDVNNVEKEKPETSVDNPKVKKNENEKEKSSSTSGGNSKQSKSSNVKEAKETQSAPEAFWLIFSGEYTKAMSKDWHSGHFSCWQCDEALTGQRYVLRDDHPYCIKCYESVFANVCEECNKIIGIDSKDLSYKDKHWHEACFLCNKCRVSLVDKQFGSKADKIYCGNCYDAQFASRCDGCGEIFRAGTKKMEYKTRQWHEKCFCCCVCKTPIGTKSFIPREQEIYCATCYEEKFATRCVKCNKIITSGGVTYKNEPWHRECFTCTNCNTSLAGQRFTSRDEKPYCADCFGELFAKRCTSCSRPITGIGGTRFISFEDRHWHNDCFICASCKTSLVGRGFITDGDDIICPECAKQKLM